MIALDHCLIQVECGSILAAHVSACQMLWYTAFSLCCVLRVTSWCLYCSDQPELLLELVSIQIETGNWAHHHHCPLQACCSVCALSQVYKSLYSTSQLRHRLPENFLMFTASSTVRAGLLPKLASKLAVVGTLFTDGCLAWRVMKHAFEIFFQ